MTDEQIREAILLRLYERGGSATVGQIAQDLGIPWEEDPDLKPDDLATLRGHTNTDGE